MTALKQLRADLIATGLRSRGRRYPPELQARVVTWASARRASGMTTVAISDALGIPWQTIARWSESDGSAWREVAVAPATVGPGMMVRSPRGYVVEGLDLDGIATLLERLG